MEREAYFRELSIRLQREGFTPQPEEEGLLPVEWNGSPLCWISESGCVRYRPEEVNAGRMDPALTKATNITCTVREYMTMMEAAPPLKAVGLEDGFRLLADFNGTVLAGKQTQYGVNFVTWDWSYDRTGVNHGHYYMENYRGAKEDFIVRSGLLLRERLFTQEQLVELYRAVRGFLHEEYPSSCHQEDQCLKLLAQIQVQVPDLDRKLAQEEGQTFEQTM